MLVTSWGSMERVGDDLELFLEHIWTGGGLGSSLKGFKVWGSGRWIRGWKRYRIWLIQTEAGTKGVVDGIWNLGSWAGSLVLGFGLEKRYLAWEEFSQGDSGGIFQGYFRCCLLTEKFFSRTWKVWDSATGCVCGGWEPLILPLAFVESSGKLVKF